MRVRGDAADLRLQLAIARSIDGRKRRTSGGQCLGIGHAPRGAKNSKKLIALPADAPEHSQLLKNHGPGDDGEEKKKSQDAARDPSRLRKNTGEISRKNRCEQKNDVLLSENRNFSGRLKP